MQADRQQEFQCRDQGTAVLCSVYLAGWLAADRIWQAHLQSILSRHMINSHPTDSLHHYCTLFFHQPFVLASAALAALPPRRVDSLRMCKRQQP